MSRWFILTFLTGWLFLSTPVISKIEHRVLVIFAIDHSPSMFEFGNPRWNIATRVAFETYFKNYQLRCQDVDVKYVAWGDSVDKPFNRELRSQADADSFSHEVLKHSFMMQSYTNPYAGIGAATLLVQDGYDRVIIVVISDADGLVEKRIDNFKNYLPTDVEFIGIALDGDSTVEFFKKYLIPVNGKVLPSRTQDELVDTFSDVMDEIGYDYCKVS
jgi:hypothetical protein